MIIQLDPLQYEIVPTDSIRRPVHSMIQDDTR